MDRLASLSWTRRRLGLVASGLAATLLSLSDPASLDARNKRKRRRRRRRRKIKRQKRRNRVQCLKLRQPCDPAGLACCNGRTCGGNPDLGRFCCKQGGESCDGDDECCNRSCFQGACALN